MFCSNSSLYCFTWSSNQLLNLNIFLFCFFRLFNLSTRFFSGLTLEYSAINRLANLFQLFPSSWLILVLFWWLWILVTVHKPCHVPHASWVTTWGTIFIERLFSVSQEWVRSWSHAFLITYDKTLTKKILAVRPEKVTRRRKRKNRKNRMAIAKFFAFNANAVRHKWQKVDSFIHICLFSSNTLKSGCTLAKLLCNIVMYFYRSNSASTLLG